MHPDLREKQWYQEEHEIKKQIRAQGAGEMLPWAVSERLQSHRELRATLLSYITSKT